MPRSLSREVRAVRTPSRRTFVKGLALGGAAASVGLLPARASAQPRARSAAAVIRESAVHLRIGETAVNVTGRPRAAVTINDSIPGPLLRWREGDTVSVQVENALDEETSVHWHGLLVPANMDGVPGLSFSGIGAGRSFEYRFTLKQHGTYWYHSHSGFQEQRGLYGPLVIDPRDPDPIESDREHVILLSDWTDEAPERVFSKLKKEANYYNFHQRTLTTLVEDVRRRGWRDTLADRRQWGTMRMSAADLADVTGATYTYLMNGQAPAANWTGLFAHGETVRLRFVNGSAMTYFDVRIPGLTMTVVAADGQPVRPVPVDEFRIAVAETFDVLVTPTGQEAFTILAQAMDRTGAATGTLATRAGLSAPVPALDPRPVLTMADMGHGGMDHAMPAAPANPSDPHAGHVMPGHDMSAMDRGRQTHPATEAGNPLVDMQTTMPAAKLDDPGIGLRGNGRRVLTYADLASTFDDPDGREPTRTIELHLTGHMERFAWSFNGVSFSGAEPVRLSYGERVRIVLVNDTMMTHPIHLHGMWSDLEDEQGRFKVRKHTIDMPPGSRRSYRVTADALGRWAYHCHMLFHMEAGMLRELRVDEARQS